VGPRVAVARGLLKLIGVFGRGLQNANRPVLSQFTFSFRGLPPAFDGFRILHLSDFHFNERPGFVDAMCNVVNGVESDICLLTGDYRFNLSVPRSSARTGMQRLLATIAPRHGTVAILGNNDMSDSISEFGAMGVRILVNESFRLSIGDDTMWIAGVDDPHEFLCDSIPLALRDVPPGAFTILLAHSPEIISQAADYGVDLYLCGHTHGGQVCLPRIGPLFLNARCKRAYMAGRWRCGDMQGYTTRGIGASTIPIRFNCPPEAVVIELKREA
jgi:predicted MPP superfamily phosphohydrolase